MAERSFLDDAPWDGCPHGNYEFRCAGCWEALIGQAKKADEWKDDVTRRLFDG